MCWDLAFNHSVCRRLGHWFGPLAIACGIFAVLPTVVRANDCGCNPCGNPCGCPNSAAPTQPSTEPPTPGQAAPAEAPSNNYAYNDTGMEPTSIGGDVGGYIDYAIVRSRVQIRYDKGDGANSDRAEFMYAAWSVNGGPVNFMLNKLNFQDVTTYLEYAPTCNFSFFAEIPVQFNSIESAGNQIGPTPPPGAAITSSSGLADVTAGFKYALVNDSDRWLTFQFKVYTPTGDASQALGVGHVSLEPGLLFQRENCGWTLFGELRDWIGIPGTIESPAQGTNPNGDFIGDAFTGNVIRYGIGLGYDFYDCTCPCCHCCERKLTGVVEFVGWTCLSGLESNLTTDSSVTPVQSAVGDTIVNAKVGARYSWNGCNSLYVGYGFPMTDLHWYTSLLRVQYEYQF